jgi:hypothetical protein
MFIIDLTLKNHPATLSVQLKSADDANSTYQTLVSAMKANSSDLLELTCEFQTGKRVSVRVSDLSAVQIAEKTSTATASGRPPGFLAVTQS